MSEENSKRPAPPPVIKNRYEFGRMADIIDLPNIRGEEGVFQAEVLFCHTDAGWDGEGARAMRYLVPGHIYRTSRIQIYSSSSSIEIEDFPGVWFNTVLFSSVPSRDAQQQVATLTASLAAVTAERDAARHSLAEACSQYQTLKEGASVNQELGATLIRQRDAAALERDALAARCRELEGALRSRSKCVGGVCPECDAVAAALLTPATPAAKAEEHPCSCGRPECKYDRHHGNGPYPAAKPETTTGGGAA